MINTHPLVSVKTLTDYHLESFLKCPYKFYYQHILMLNSGQVKWRQVVQSIINQVVHNFYQLPPNAQNQLNIMKLIDRYWKHVSPKAIRIEDTLLYGFSEDNRPFASISIWGEKAEATVIFVSKIKYLY